MDDEQRWRYTRRGALGLMGVGVVGAASETIGFTNVTAGRPLSIAVDSDLAGGTRIEAIDNSGSGGAGGGQTLDSPGGGSFNSTFDILIVNQTGSDIPTDNLSITISVSAANGSTSIQISDINDNALSFQDSPTSGDVSTASDLDEIFQTASNSSQESLNDSTTSLEFLTGLPASDGTDNASAAIQVNNTVSQQETLSVSVTADFGGTDLDLTRDGITLESA